MPCQLPCDHWHVCLCPFAQNRHVSLFISPQSTLLTWEEVGRRGGQNTEPPCVRGRGEGGVFFLFFSPSALFFSSTTADCYTDWWQFVSGRVPHTQESAGQTGSFPHCIQPLAPSSVLLQTSQSHPSPITQWVFIHVFGGSSVFWSAVVSTKPLANSQAVQLKFVWINSESLFCYMYEWSPNQLFSLLPTSYPSTFSQPIFPLSNISSPCIIWAACLKLPNIFD